MCGEGVKHQKGGRAPQIKSKVESAELDSIQQNEAQIIRELEDSEKKYRPAKLWTEFEDQTLKRFYGKVPVKLLAAKLHRSSGAVKCRVSILDLTDAEHYNKVRKR